MATWNELSAEDQQKQVEEQYRAVVHMARALASVHDQKLPLIQGGHASALATIQGMQSAAIMEALGNILNDMDAVDPEEDEWMAPIFERAHVYFPQQDHT